MITERGLRANGYLIQAGGTAYGASYSVLTDASGRTRRITVHSDSAEGERNLSLTRTPGGPWVVDSTAGSSPLYALDDSQDVDIQSSAFTNALPLRRLGLIRTEGLLTNGSDEEFVINVASISMPTLEVRSIEHRYTFRGSGVVTHRGPAGVRDLSIDEHGFVIDFPGLSYRLG